MLSSNAGIQRFYRGIVRNVEQTDDPDLFEAQGRIADVDAKDARSFLARLKKEDSCFLLHLSEGVTKSGQTDSVARRHFLALQVAPDEWAINDRFAGIHAAGLLPEDFDVLAQHGGAMIWSPLSNLLLYGATARVDAAKRAGVRIGLGSDWSPSGSKNLLGELKVAWLYSQHMLEGLFGARDLVAMATRDAAAILKWHKALGTLEPGKRADVVVIDGKVGDPYEALIKAKETSIRLVMINGVARYGSPALMGALGPEGRGAACGREEAPAVPGTGDGDPDVANVSLSAARSTLRAAFRDLPKLARELEKPRVPRAASRDAPGRWSGRSRSTRFRTPGSTCVRACPSTVRATSPGPRPRRSRRRSSALDDSSAHRAGPAHRGRRSQFPDRDRESAQRARPCPHRAGAALLAAARGTTSIQCRDSSRPAQLS